MGEKIAKKYNASFKIRHIVRKRKIGGRNMSYKVFVILLCLGITIVLAGIALVCSMNQEKIGFKVLLIGGVMAGAGLVGIVYLLFGIVTAIIAGLACVLYAIVMILTS